MKEAAEKIAKYGWDLTIRIIFAEILDNYEELMKSIDKSLIGYYKHI